MRSQRAVANRVARSRQLASQVTGAARRAERSLCASERSSQQSDGAAKRAQTPLRALACFALASPCTQTRAWFYAGELLFWPLECSIISEHPPNPPLQPTASRRDRRHFGWWYHALAAAERHPVGPLRAIIIMPHCLIRYISKYIFSLHIQGIYES